MSGSTPAAVSDAGGQSDVTMTSQMNGVITSQSRDSDEGTAGVEHSDVIKSSLAGVQYEAGAASNTDLINGSQHNDVDSRSVERLLLLLTLSSCLT